MLSSSNHLFNIAGAGSLFPLALGAIGLSNPASGFRLFNFPAPVDAQARKLATNLFLFWASRDVYMGVTAAAAWYAGEKKALGYMYVLGAGVAVSDGWMSQREIGRDAWKHVVWVPVVLFVGGGLLGWFD